ncbi:hypothetical protein MRB53_019420 [Persea americana]|uniref:Uncharacterized protein n=1 Tax=Persea americana TaxID=3435 RepID=A0ACC2KZ86_PERAE|nr:hypothetical protein MRB53_019420 [Persea americana]
MANWSEISQDLLETISNFCSLPEYIRMGAVCKSWLFHLRNTSYFARQLPWLMMLPNHDETNANALPIPTNVHHFFSLSEQRIYTIHLPEMSGNRRCCGAFNNGWLMTVDEKLEIGLFNPWSRIQVQLPHQSTFAEQHFADEGYDMESLRDLHIRKASLSDDGNMVMIVYGVGDLGFCRIGDGAWTTVDREEFLFKDVVFSKGHFYALSDQGSVCLCQIDENNDVAPSLERDVYLGDDHSQLVFPHTTVGFEVHEVVSEHGKPSKSPKKVQSLGDLVLFVGYNSPMIFTARRFLELKGNRIYFTDNYYQRYLTEPYGCRDLGIFNMEDGTVEPLFPNRFHPPLSPPLWIATPPYSLPRD